MDNLDGFQKLVSTDQEISISTVETPRLTKYLKSSVSNAIKITVRIIVYNLQIVKHKKLSLFNNI
jgi:hypothetical protein